MLFLLSPLSIALIGYNLFTLQRHKQNCLLSEIILHKKLIKMDKSLILKEIKSHLNINSDSEFANFLEITP